MEVRKRSTILALVLALAGGLAACQTGYDQEPGMRDSGTQTGQPSPGSGAGSPSGTTGGASGGTSQ
jgi:hypothetical protein